MQKNSFTFPVWNAPVYTMYKSRLTSTHVILSFLSWNNVKQITQRQIQLINELCIFTTIRIVTSVIHKNKSRVANEKNGWLKIIRFLLIIYNFLVKWLTSRVTMKSSLRPISSCRLFSMLDNEQGLFARRKHFTRDYRYFAGCQSTTAKMHLAILSLALPWVWPSYHNRSHTRLLPGYHHRYV